MKPCKSPEPFHQFSLGSSWTAHSHHWEEEAESKWDGGALLVAALSPAPCCPSPQGTAPLGSCHQLLEPSWELGTLTQGLFSIFLHFWFCNSPQPSSFVVLHSLLFISTCLFFLCLLLFLRWQKGLARVELVPAPKWITKGITNFSVSDFSVRAGCYQLSKWYLKRGKLFCPHSLPHLCGNRKGLCFYADNGWMTGEMRGDISTALPKFLVLWC